MGRAPLHLQGWLFLTLNTMFSFFGTTWRFLGWEAGTGALENKAQGEIICIKHLGGSGPSEARAWGEERRGSVLISYCCVTKYPEPYQRQAAHHTLAGVARLVGCHLLHQKN